MSKLICSSAIDGAVEWVARAESKLDEAIKIKGESQAVGFPDTAYFLRSFIRLSVKKRRHWRT